MIPIQYQLGDATKPAGTGCRIIPHVVNDYGGWGAGFVLALSAVSPEPERVYREWFASKDKLPGPLNLDVPFELGEIKLASFEPAGVYVCNMIAQRGTLLSPGDIPLSYVHLEQCLKKLRNIALTVDASVHMPRIGCGLAGGDWQEIERRIMRSLCAWNIEVVVYDLP